jgi:DNA-binding NarL/FixJ family response regulator
MARRRVTVEYEDDIPYLVTRTPIRIDTPEEITVDQLAGFCLTKREQEVLQGICQFKMNKEIAFDLHLSERTVKFHVSSLLSKYKCTGRQELASRFGTIEHRTEIQ